MYLLQSCPQFWQPLSWQQNPQNSQLQEVCLEFRLILRQDPLSVFANDVRIETTEGPMDYDISLICNCIHEEAGPYTRLGFYWPNAAKIYWIDMQIV
uniref:Uncharacterized protein n=1 Tax=Glossina palpalis gambiensis TaxID=67801 RepID=A0A1B0B6Q3_9MUSC